jgi:large subunit ribosomal protein L6
MSKIGRKPIELNNVAVEVKGKEIKYKGKKASGVYTLPEELNAEVVNKTIKIIPAEKTPDLNRLWGLHRALLANAIKGADTGFEKQLRIVGLGFKAALMGDKLQCSLGFSHKIDFPLPKEVTVEIDKTGQLLTFKSVDKVLLGQVCSTVRALRPPEPYKGTGIQYVGEVILRKAGKAKSA